MKTNTKLLIGMFVIIVVLIIGLAIYLPQMIGDAFVNMGGKTINTNGEATINVEPDQAVVYVVIETLEDDAEESKDKNSKITDDVYAALYKIGINRDDIETEYFRIYEEFDWTGDGRESKGFKTTHSLKISTEEFDDVGEIVDAAVDAGATRINRINFELSDEKEKDYKKQALAAASRDAKEKAEAIAEGMGAKLGDVVSISDSGYSYSPYRYYDMAMVEDTALALEEAVSTQISPQELTVSANVRVAYKIK